MKKLILSLAVVCWMLQTAPAQGSEKPCPCCTENYRQFDFWLGDWKTYDPKGDLAGTNHIVLLHDQCVLQENWVSEGGGYTGTSYNFYDDASDQWTQIWVDNQGGSLQLTGGMEGGSMVLKSDPSPQSEGGSMLNQISWTPNEDGTVRQHWELSRDYGATWTTLFDGLYKKD
jgi:hypothetical protein